MKLNLKKVAFGLALTGGLAGNAMAVGTEAGTDVNNRATLQYSVGGGGTLTIESSPTGNTGPSGSDTTFKVDRRLDVEVSGGGTTLVQPDDDDAVIKFTLTNNGNADQGVIVTTAVDAGDDFDAEQAATTQISLCVDTNGNGSYDSGTDVCVTGTSPSLEIDTLLHDSGSNTIDVFLVGDIPSSVVNGNLANYTVQAQVGETGADADPTNTDVVAITADDNAVDKNASDANKNTVLDLFADDAGTAAGDVARDGKHSADGTYQVQAPDLTVSKVATVVWDPVSCTNPEPTGVAVATCTAASGSASPKAIPGALIEYTIRVANGSPNAASGVVLTDDLTDEIVTDPSVEFVADSYNGLDPNGNVLDDDGCPAGSDCGVLINKDEGGTNELQVHTNADDSGAGLYSDDSDWSVSAANTVTSSLDGGTVAGNSTMTLTFRVRVLQ